MHFQIISRLFFYLFSSSFYVASSNEIKKSSNCIVRKYYCGPNSCIALCFPTKLHSKIYIKNPPRKTSAFSAIQCVSNNHRLDGYEIVPRNMISKVTTSIIYVPRARLTHLPDSTSDRLSTFVTFSWAYTSWYLSDRTNFMQFSTVLNWWRVTRNGLNRAAYTCEIYIIIKRRETLIKLTKNSHLSWNTLI